MANVQVKIVLSEKKELVKTVEDTTPVEQGKTMLENYLEAAGHGGVTFTDDDNIVHVIPLQMITASRTEIKEVEPTKRKRTTKKA